MKKRPYLIAFFIFLIDLISKQIISHSIALNNSITIIPRFFYLTYVKNTGAAWSILKDQRILLMLITVIVLFIINQYIHKEKLSKWEELAFGFIMGGIVGNLFDRLFFSYVIDFLDFKIFGYNYPIFNFADTFIVLGVIIIMILSFRKGKYERN